MAMALARLTANIGGPGERRRRLYATTVMSVVLYGAPIWVQTVANDRGILRDVQRLQRQLALRIIRGYRTVSHEAASVLSGMVPFDIVADRLRRSYLRRRDIICRSGTVEPRMTLMLSEVERRRSILRWRERLIELPPDRPGAIVRGAFVEDLENWSGGRYSGAHSPVLSSLGGAEEGAAGTRGGMQDPPCALLMRG
ncbi:PREDICTED: uncharacterized protein LOC108750929 [Trachymyrmex septentrionalis]|uniref:uncharacterized protein LOC108750929 n=1 Tax=Trachymyrmex septentrionalis TaxID=34720 RepID=UPI00084F6866|nr:PREDICTED: uncharacterized protein LOC108750929 [Trachymyrmex septentrionalis]